MKMAPGCRNRSSLFGSVLGEAVEVLTEVFAEAFELEEDRAATTAVDVVGVVAFKEA